MTNERQWIFYDSISKTQSNSIASNEAQMAIFKMKKKDWPRFYIWTTGWNDWQPLDLFLKSDQTYFITKFAQPSNEVDTVKYYSSREVLSMQNVTESVHKEITKSFSGVSIKEDSVTNQQQINENFEGDELSWSKTKKPEVDFTKLKERNSYGLRDPRHELKIDLLLVSAKGTIFKSASKNISLSGSLLEDNIPFDYYGLIFEVIIVNRGALDPARTRVALKGQTVGDGLTQRLSFCAVTEIQKKLLEALLQDYLNQQAKHKTKPKTG